MVGNISFVDWLKRRAPVVLDGAIGTELQRRGAKMDSAAWCALATKTHPEVLKQIHGDYLDAGADIITTNTFASARHVLDAVGLAEESPDLNRSAVDIARKAAQGVERDVLVAGSMSSMGALDRSTETPQGDAVLASYIEQAHVLAESGVDVLVAEMMIDISNSSLVFEAASEVNLPLMIGWSVIPDEEGGIAPYRDYVYSDCDAISFEELVESGLEVEAEVAGVMHSPASVTGQALGILAKRWDGPLMAYSETGNWEPPNWVFENELTPSEYSDWAQTWADAGVRIVGGCCGTSPAHIAELSARLKPTD